MLKALVQARQKQNWIGPPYRYKYPSGNVSVYAEAIGGSGGMFPEICEMASEVIFGAQNISTNLCFSPGLVTGFWFTLRLDAWR